MKKASKRITLLLFGFIILMFHVKGNGVIKAQEINGLTEMEEIEIEEVIKENLDEGKIPGLSITIVKDDKTVYQKGFGYSDLDEEKPVTPQSLFELASNSKAFTALAIFSLVESNQIQLHDEVTTYIPWLKVKYKGKEVPLTIEQTIHQTTGIHPRTIDKIPVSIEDSALEETVRTLVGIELETEPGKRFQYATINYDILGLIIEKVTGNTYESYIDEHILQPLELNNTYLFRDKAINDRIVTGYKMGFFKPRVYDAPIYRGNKPAGYIISSGEDMAKWLKIQMGSLNKLDFDKNIIKNTHMAESAVDALGNEVLYAGGWFLEPNGQIMHDGMNPNYSSYVIFNKKKRIGVAILSNLSSNLVYNIALGINDVLLGESASENIADSNQLIDKLAVGIIVVLSVLILIFSIFILKVFRKISRKQLNFNFDGMKSSLNLSISLLFMLGLSYLINVIPKYVMGMSWGTVFVWSPSSVKVAVYTLYIGVWYIYLFFILKVIFKKK